MGPADRTSRAPAPAPLVRRPAAIARRPRRPRRPPELTPCARTPSSKSTSSPKCPRRHPETLCVLATMDGDRSTEAELHRRFHSYRLSGEWFKPEPDLMDFIAILQQKP
ncbi:GIY-YIG nuclease family protein [Sorangium sp. So ce388]|uniref:GIY-YIG nuclease family protein n=1 Tax=Sorangium sp. So ce388 TaxID=3133309 RepID=UPI003F5B073D